MNSLARRTLRTTAAAAGMTALGVGLAGNALAAPVAQTPVIPEGVSTLPGVPALPTEKPLALLTDAAQGKPLPMLFAFQGPTINTSGPSGSALPGGVDKIRTAGSPVRTQPVTATAQTRPATVSPQTGSAEVAPAASPSRVGALSALDSAGMFDDLLAQPAVDQHGLGATGFALGGLG
jgi:hypothetical protein